MDNINESECSQIHFTNIGKCYHLKDKIYCQKTDGDDKNFYPARKCKNCDDYLFSKRGHYLCINCYKKDKQEEKEIIKKYNIKVKFIDDD
jgi:hypothetical protein